MTDIRVIQSADEMAARAVEMIITAARDAIAARGRFTLAFTGGSSPEKTYALLAQPEKAGQVEWSKSLLFWGDDRFVPPEDPRSNFGMVARTLLQHIDAPPENLYPMPVEAPSPAQGADYYADTLAQAFGLPVGSAEPPVFDLILLGLGDDGHIASLFPGYPTLEVADRWVVSTPPGTLPPPVDRITLTYPVLNAARQVLFLVLGDSKAEAVRDVLEGGAKREVRPAAGVQPTNGAVTWLLDRAAAGQLTQSVTAHDAG